MEIENDRKEKLENLIKDHPLEFLIEKVPNEFVSLFDHSNVGVTLSYPDGTFISNETYYKIVGHSREEMKSRTWIDITHPDDVDRDKETFKKLLSNELTSYVGEKRYISSTGEVIWVDVSSIKLPYRNESILLNIFTNITEEKRAYEELKNSQEQYELLFSANPLPIAIFETETLKFLAVNDSFIDKYGYSREEILKMTILDIRPKDEVSRTKKNIAPTDTGIVNVGEYVHTKKNGENITVEIYRHDINFKGKAAKIVVLNDVTLKKKAEQTFLETQRLQAMGEMAASVSHDFNNSLQSIVGNLELLRNGNLTEDELRNKLHLIKDIIVDVSSRIQSLQKLGQANRKKNNEVIDPIPVIEELLSQIIPSIVDDAEKRGISIVINTDFCDDEPIQFSKADFTAVMLNLIKNSVEAMPLGGEILVCTKRVDDNLSILVRDTGLGMTDAVKAKIFDPYFTTKGFELGRGLGLSGVYALVKGNSGEIHVKETIVGQGTTFEILLPIADFDRVHGPEEKDGKTVSTDSNESKGTLRVLWVEDQAIIRATSKAMVIKMGHECDAAKNANQALEKLTSNEYDIIISDLGMPGMNGLQLCSEVRKLYGSKIPFIIVSGWELTDAEKQENGVTESITKPFFEKRLSDLLNSYS